VCSLRCFLHCFLLFECSLIFFQTDEDGQLFQIYTVARKHFGKGGMNRIRYTLVPLVFGYIGLAARLKKSCASPAPKKESSNPEDEELSEADKGTFFWFFPPFFPLFLLFFFFVVIEACQVFFE
jgi:hypothetical protein